MKKNLLTIGAFCLGICLSIAVGACAVDGDSPNSPSLNQSTPGFTYPKIKQCILGDDGFYTLDYNYDSKGRICEITGILRGRTNDTFNIEYSNNKIIIHYYSYPDETEEGLVEVYLDTMTVVVEDLNNLTADGINALIIDLTSVDYF